MHCQKVTRQMSILYGTCLFIWLRQNKCFYTVDAHMFTNWPSLIRGNKLPLEFTHYLEHIIVRLSVISTCWVVAVCCLVDMILLVDIFASAASLAMVSLTLISSLTTWACFSFQKAISSRDLQKICTLCWLSHPMDYIMGPINIIFRKDELCYHRIHHKISCNICKF